MAALARVTLKRGRDESLRRGHPWVFSGAVERVDGNPARGELVQVNAADGSFRALAAWSPDSQIRLRAWTMDPAEPVDDNFFRRRLEQALAARRLLGLLQPDGGCRLIHGEADGLPGLIVDHYAGYLVCQFLSAGAETWRDLLLDLLEELLTPSGIFERSAASARRREGLPSRQGLLRGTAPPDPVEIRSRKLRMLASIAHGQKTGAYLDQQDNHWRVAQHAAGARVLDVFAHTGGFALAALTAGAGEATLVESSADTLEQARQQAALNGLAERCRFVVDNAFEQLRALLDAGERFDLVVLDPPKFVHNAGQLKRGARGYKDINRLGMALLKPNGLLATFSCSGNVDRPLFQKILAGAALDAGRQASIVEQFGQSADHPIALAVPDSEYLKGFLLQVR